MTYPAHPFTGNARRWLLAVSLLAALSGCAMPAAQQGDASGSVVAGSDQGKPVDANLSGFLEQAPPGAVTDLPTSPGKTHEKPLYDGLRSALPVGANVVI